MKIVTRCMARSNFEKSRLSGDKRILITIEECQPESVRVPGQGGNGQIREDLKPARNPGHAG